MAKKSSLIAPASTIAYVALFQCLSSAPRSRLKLVGASHSVAITALTLYALRQSPFNADISQGPPLPNDSLDDSRNPLIREKSPLASAITALEAGYLVFDTWALVQGPGARSTIAKSPVLVLHHVGLATALLILQVYIYYGREKGIWIIAAFMLMRASGPLLTLRWWLKNANGSSPLLLDVAHAVVFAGARFGVVGWILTRYGAFHGLSAWDAYKRLRLTCQAGTASLVAMNTVWFMAMAKGISRRMTRG